MLYGCTIMVKELRIGQGKTLKYNNWKMFLLLNMEHGDNIGWVNIHETNHIVDDGAHIVWTCSLASLWIHDPSSDIKNSCINVDVEQVQGTWVVLELKSYLWLLNFPFKPESENGPTLNRKHHTRTQLCWRKPGA
jgi:hypothetical protein